MIRILFTLLFVVAMTGLVFANGQKGASGIKIGVVLPDASEERWANQDGAFFKAELENLGAGYEFEILFSEGDESKEKQNVEALIAKGAKVIIITAHGNGGASVAAAHAENVVVVAHDRMAKSAADVADYYTTFNSWNVGKAMGKHLVDAAKAAGYSASKKADLAIFSGRVVDWPNATYFFGGAFEELQPNLAMFNIVNQDPAPFLALKKYTEATFNDAAKDALQAAMLPIDTDWNPETAGIKAAGVVAQIKKTSDAVFVLAPNDDTSAAIRQEFAKMATPYAKYYTTGQDASNVTLASLMGDVVTGKGTQTMTVFKDVSKLVKDSVAIAKNVVDGKDGLTGLNSGPSIDGAKTAYSPIDTLLATNPQLTYDTIFATGYKSEDNPDFDAIDFTPYK
ncbi:substrate-binding domain-containing protein [Oceanispirochaeta sp.]|jgi:putative multiple sugar transport system substrate-binding protein|uniref:substrate-binding domain-containing protein n=1 Tax=Oceanispirochaeta sp. TaxID=2035350 RepID=UPI00260204A2|nr:substrate-binding domain-containing protein [Oceanispirochaeta sp.]MDA3957116.1 substrate-binding domain-containing protein [Oceanispirochaeta sp.]